MKKLVKDFIHRPGVHCESTALRDIYEFQGFNFSEPMIFGLGSGLGFIYWKMKKTGFPFIGGRARDLDRNLCLNLGVDLRIYKTSSRKKAHESLIKQINDNIPVMIHVDMPYLKYLGLPEKAHFGGHVVVVAGLDEENGTVYIADTRYEKMQLATFKELEEARASGYKPFLPDNRWFEFRFPLGLTPTEEAIRKAIVKTADSMLNPPIKNLGIRGIRYFAEEIVNWPRDYPPDRFKHNYELTYIYMNEDGTGGGLFRYLYSKFLEEAGRILGDRNVTDTSKKYLQIGRKWAKVAEMIRDIPEKEINPGDAGILLHTIAGEEERMLSSLMNCVNK